MRRNLLKVAGATLIASLAFVQQAAAAQLCVLGLCINLPIPSAPGGAPGAPEIDVAQGAAALVILSVAVMLLREAFLRSRAKA